ncbi:MAG: hypothetical protein O9264_15970 [Leptospira sp.]|nr:hypothetical protein [Leptospira sp.]
MFKKIFVITAIGLLYFNCSMAKSSENNNSSSLVALLVSASSNPGCAITSASAITSNLSQVESKARTKYTISNCDEVGFNTLDLNQTSVTKGAIGISGSSVLSTKKDVMLATSKGGTNIEVTFTLNSQSSSLDVIAYGTGSPLDGPIYRIATGVQTQYKSTSGTFANTSKGGSVSAPIPVAGTSYTYCLDFQSTPNGSRLLNGFNKPCAELTETERGSMSLYPIMQMMMVPTYSGGNRLGFVLNGVTITSFTIGSIVSNTEM